MRGKGERHIGDGGGEVRSRRVEAAGVASKLEEQKH